MAIEFEYKSLRINEKLDGQILYITVIGKLEKEDYDLFVPEIEEQIKKYGKVRFFIELHEFAGWTVSAAWEDCKFGFRHFSDIERIAIVGDKSWEHGMAIFLKPFTKAKVRYFDIKDHEDAEGWIKAEKLSKAA